MRTLDRYVLREWAKVFFVVMIGFPVLVIVIDFTDKLGQYLGRMSKATVALAYLFAVPEIMFLVLPAAVLFATVFLVGSLGRHSEITAAKASGVSFHRLVRPLYLIAVAASLSGVVLGEIYPVSSNRKEELLGVKQIRSTSSRYNFVYRADGGWVYAIAALQVAVPTMTDLLLEREGRGAEYPTIVIAAQRAVYDTAGVKRGRTGGRGAQRSWSLQRGTLRYLLGPQQELAFNFAVLRTRATLQETPQALLAEPTPPDAMRYAELGRYIDALARSGSDTRKLAVERALKIAIPFICIVVALFGAPLAVSTPSSGPAWGVGVSLATTFVALLMFQLAKAVGAGGVLPPMVAAWFPNLLFGAGAAWLLKRTRT
jgi:lipopolysaccharide export system permease protein